MANKQGGSFRVGQKVWLEHTGEEAIIERIDKTGLLYVNAGGHVIPVFMSQVVKRLPTKPVDPKEAAAQAEQKAIEEKEKSSHQVVDKAKIKSPRVCLLFVPQKLKDGEIVRYDCGLLNETDEPFAAQCMLFKNTVNESVDVNVAACSFRLIKRFDSEHLNDIIAVRIKITPDNATLELFELEQKIKPSSFIKKSAAVESMAVEAFVYTLLENFIVAPRRSDVFAKDESSHELENSSADPWNLKHLRQLILEQPTAKDFLPAGTAEKEVDLHADAFLKTSEGLTSTDILLLQLDRFRQLLERAVFSGQKVLLVVHGVGKGKLKKEIEKILNDDERVIDYRDASYPKYGYGATEVILK